tara:strand:+ start:45 stop:770 length:726 start_codon:yes stop_codon:yes gene_type:complete
MKKPYEYYPTGIDWNLFLNEIDLLHGDKPVYIPNFLPNPEKYCNFIEVERMLNTQAVEWKLAGNEDNKDISINIPEYLDQFNDPYQCKQTISEGIKNGFTFFMRGYSFQNPYINALCAEIDDLFSCNSEGIVFGSKVGIDNSFTPHTDPDPIFAFQIEGNITWTLFDNKCTGLYSRRYINNTRDINKLTNPTPYNLSPGDFLYVPTRTYHKIKVKEPRLTLSVANFNEMYTSKADRNYYQI